MCEQGRGIEQMGHASTFGGALRHQLRHRVPTGRPFLSPTHKLPRQLTTLGDNPNADFRVAYALPIQLASRRNTVAPGKLRWYGNHIFRGNSRLHGKNLFHEIAPVNDLPPASPLRRGPRPRRVERLFRRARCRSIARRSAWPTARAFPPRRRCGIRGRGP